MESKAYLESLNSVQRQAVEATSGPVLIVAGAGAGKTKTLTSRIVHLIHTGVAPHSILAITFTNKAATEMRERVHAMLKHEHHTTLPFIATFHSLGVSILRAYADRIGRTRTFTILDEGDAIKLIKESLIELGYDPKQHDPKKIKNVISRQKGNFITLEKFTDHVDSSFDEVVLLVWKKYHQKMLEEKTFDFDDLLLETVLLLEKHPDIQRLYQERFLYIHIDEYQDTNEVQYALTKLLVGKEKNLCVVGDTDQNIYSWRGAELRHMLHFEKDFPGTRVFFLEQNYRSTKTILEAANIVIKKNSVRVDKTLFTENTTGEPISLFEAYTETDEAEFIADRIDSILASGSNPDEIAILYRANFQSRVLEEALLQKNVPYQVLGTKFYDRKEVKDMLAYIRAARSRDSLSDIKRIINFPTRGLGKVTLQKLFSGQIETLPKNTQDKIQKFYLLLDSIANASLTLPPSELIKKILIESGIEKELQSGDQSDLERLENIRELVSVALAYDVLPIDEGLSKLLDDAALASDQDSLLEKKTGVRLMTVHAAKGLEFDTVFITGLEQDLFPHARSTSEKPEYREEERRLFYVALTRARQKLFLTYASVRTLFGMRQITTPSEYLYDIPDELTTRESREANKPLKVVYID